MKEKEKEWFENLQKETERDINTLLKKRYRGIWETAIKKYSDTAHFVYELLQNADDAQAKEVYFLLEEDGLWFRHNGKRFTISDPKNETIQLGDINAITAMGDSSKDGDNNEATKQKIGKFGIGFKSVFAYTATPKIYDGFFNFEIDKFIVPKTIEKCDKHSDGTTLFYFPFNQANSFFTEYENLQKLIKTPEKAYRHIAERLKSLFQPILFLSNIQAVVWETTDDKGEYTKSVKKEQTDNDITYQIVETKNNKEIGEILLFSRNEVEKKQKYTVGFLLKDNKLKSSPHKAFCFFPTEVTTGLNFIIHAPFLLTDNREGIEKENDWNKNLIQLLAQLSADSLPILKELKLIDDDIIQFIPYKKSQENILFVPFYDAIKKKFQKEELLPAKKGYAEKENAYWAQDKPVLNLFSDEQLASLIDEENAKWVFRSLVRNQTEKNEELRGYVEDCITDWYNMSKILEMIDGNFIEKQSNDWLKEFYEYLSRYKSYWQEVKEKPIFLNKNREAVPAFDWDENLILFLPDNDGEGYETVNLQLFKIVGKKLLEKFGIREYTFADEIDDAIERFENDEIEAESFFFKAFKYFKDECPQNEIDEFIERIKDLAFIPYINNENEEGFSIGKSLFYPTEYLITFYSQRPSTEFVNIELLNGKIPEKKILDSFLKKLGVNDKKPELKDEINNIIIPKYNANISPQVDESENFNDLKTIVNYFQKCPNDEVETLIEKLKDLEFLLCIDDRFHYYSPQEIYYPSDELKMYFESKSDTKFINYEAYYTSLENEQERQAFDVLLTKLGVSSLPRIKKVNLSWQERTALNLQNGSGTYSSDTHQFIIDGCSEILENINKEKSLLLWKVLSKLQHKVDSYWNDEAYYLNNELQGINKYFYRTWHFESFESKTLTDLRTKEWLLNTDGELVSPQNISQSDLDEEYKRNFELEELLGFIPSNVLTEKEEKLQTFDKLFDSVEEAKEAKKALEEKRARENSNPIGEPRVIEPDQPEPLKRSIETLGNLQKTIFVGPHTRSKPGTNTIEFNENEELAKGIEKLKDGLEIKKQRTEYVEAIKNSTKYSYQWFQAYLELLKTFGEKQDNQKQKSISFQEIKPYKTDNKYFLLCGASSYISPEIENAEEFKISLIFGNGKKENIKVEGVSKKGLDLLIYCRESLSNEIVSKFSSIFKVEISFTPVIDLLNRLYNAFINSNNVDEWESIEDALPALNYIYGPPGTGKTTTLCNKIEEIIKADSNKKILVLTPTNKAADVVCKKLWEINDEISAIRLSKPTDPELEEEVYIDTDEGTYRDTINQDVINRISVLASTIHRLPYFNIQDDGLLFQYDWDYVIFDEASMIGLHYITFALIALYKTNPETEFIIAGDPKQIPPVIEINDKELENFDFQDENIYKMMNLESFDPKEQKIRKKDSIQNLDTQYRSILQIGRLFSELSYSGLLKHYREKENKETKSLPSEFKNLISTNVTFLNIPLHEEDSVYKINKLFYSSYHIYSAILVTEIVKYFDSVNKDEQWTIGLIAPYKAQAVLMNKLITSYGISENIKVYSDTVHGFQGDECDIVLFVCNPNNYQYTGHPKALLSKEYIYNVAISRAKDYLVILHPFETIQNPFINNIGLSYKNNFGDTKIKNAAEIERKLFKDHKHIEKNSYLSGHDSINVFGLSDMKYFIKANDTAIDIQLRDLKSHQVKDSKSENEIIKRKYSDKKIEIKVIGNIDLSKFEKYKKK